MAFDIVTGGAGFIGSHLVDRLVEQGRSVRVLDNFSNGSESNIEHHKNNSNVDVVDVDVGDYERLRDLFKGVKNVYHLAALADIVPSINEPDKYFNSNVIGTYNVVRSAEQANAGKLIYAASSSCYGIPDQFPTPETAAIKPQYPYALTKRLGEEIVMHWGQVYKLPVLSLRLFNVYGPRARTGGTYGAVFGVFLAQLSNKKPLTIVGDGTQTRDFTFVSDVVDAFMLAAKSEKKGLILNVGSKKTFSVNYLVSLLGAKNIEYIPKRPGEPDCTWADVREIQKHLKWRPKFSFEEGVKTMLENLHHWTNAPVWTPKKIEQATKSWFKYLDE